MPLRQYQNLYPLFCFGVAITLQFGELASKTRDFCFLTRVLLPIYSTKKG